MFSDLRYVLRSLARTKGFTTVTVLTLAFGIGAAAAIFSVVDRLLLQAIRAPDDLVCVMTRDKQGHMGWLRQEHVQAYGGLDRVFAGTAVAVQQTVNIVLAGEPIGSRVLAVSPSLLPLFEVVPAHGRGFMPDEDQPGRTDVVVVSHEFGQKHFHGALDVVGRTLIVDQSVCTIVGVLAPRQALPVLSHPEVIRPLEERPNTGDSASYALLFFGRLRAGVTLEQANLALDATHVGLSPNLEMYFAEAKPRAELVRDIARSLQPKIFWIVVAAVAFLYSIACLNATNLMLVRLLGRRREMSIRLALGGGRVPLIRLCLLEGAALALLASAVAVLLANWLVPLLMFQAGFGANFDWARWTLDGRTVPVLAALTMATTLFIVTVPALWIVRANVNDGLKEGGGSLGESRRLARLRGGFVVVQAAFAVILLTGAGLMVRTIERLHHVPLGYNEGHLMKLRLDFPAGHVAGGEARLALLQELQTRLARVPGVVAASYGTDTLLPGYYYGDIDVELTDGSLVKAKVEYVSADYFTTAGMTLLRGRMGASTGAEVMINESFARARFGDEDPIGMLLNKPADAGSGASAWVVVGVVADVRDRLREGPGYHLYAPETWWPPAMNTFILRVAASPDAQMAGLIKRAVYESDPQLVVLYVAGLGELRESWTGPERFVKSVLQVLSGMALGLATVGLFSVLAYAVSCRMGEFGIRMALGATAHDLVRLVVRRGLLLAAGGVLLGLAGAVALVRYLQSLLYETAPHDPAVLALVSGLLLATAGLACAWPARRATKANVAALLRRE